MNKKKIVIISVSVLATIAVILTFLNILKSAQLSILVTPLDAKILINNKEFKNGTYRFFPGEVSVKIEKEGMETKEYSIELKRNHTETLYDYLIGLGDNKFDVYNHNLADYNALKLIAGDDEKSADFIKKTERKLSIAEILPLERFVEATTPAPETGMLGRETQISLGTDKEGCDELICLYLLNNTGSLDTARELVQEYGYNLDDYKIINYVYPPLD